MANLDGLVVFAKVVEAGGFSAAARELGLSKSAVSKRISALEDRLGARLLNRTTRRLATTEVGASFYERCARVVAEAEEAERAVTLLQAEPRGTLRVSVPMSFGVRHLAPTIAEFMTRHPDLRVDLNLNDRIVDLIEEGYDLAVRIARLPDSSLVARVLAPSRRVVCAAPAYWRRHGRPRQPEDLKHHDVLMYAYTLTGDELTFRGPDGPVSVKVSGRLCANNGDILLAAALDGLGVLATPTFLAGDELRAGRLEAVLGDYDVANQSVYAVYPHNRHLSAKVRVFVDFLARRFGPEPYWDAGLADQRPSRHQAAVSPASRRASTRAAGSSAT